MIVAGWSGMRLLLPVRRNWRARQNGRAPVLMVCWWYGRRLLVRRWNWGARLTGRARVRVTC